MNQNSFTFCYREEFLMFPFLLITLPNNVNRVIQFWTSCFQSAFIFISLPRVPNGRFREVFLHHWRLFSFAWILVRFRASASNSLDSSTAQCYPYHVLSQKSSIYFFESNRKSWQQFFWNFRDLDRMLFHYRWWSPSNFPFRWISFSYCSSPCRFKVGIFRCYSLLFL